MWYQNICRDVIRILVKSKNYKELPKPRRNDSTEPSNEHVFQHENLADVKIMSWFLAHNHFIGFIIDLDWTFLCFQSKNMTPLPIFEIAHYHFYAMTRFVGDGVYALYPILI